jgi:hypothetical protein
MNEKAKELGKKITNDTHLIYDGDTGKITPLGLTLREHFAGLAMQGMLVNFDSITEQHYQKKVAELSVQVADALLAELSKEE